ncbi:MAG: hypothetical protein ABSA92_11520 [Candidatus Bathyarchaeia archaeon]
MPVRKYRMTLATRWYDQEAEKQRSFEAHFIVVRRGNIRTIRKQLINRAVPWFQRLIKRRFKRRIPRRQIRGDFEREEPALVPQRDIQINMLTMEFRGRKHHAHAEPSAFLSFTRRKRRKTGKTKRRRKRATR